MILKMLRRIDLSGNKKLAMIDKVASFRRGGFLVRSKFSRDSKHFLAMSTDLALLSLRWVLSPQSSSYSVISLIIDWQAHFFIHMSEIASVAEGLWEGLTFKNILMNS
jgi:hypothetical protein